jgi:predicted nucleic acid-binding protein
MFYLDTSVLVSLLVPEAASSQVRAWMQAHITSPLAISAWTLTEFASAIGIKQRTQQIPAALAADACAVMEQLARDSLVCLSPIKADYQQAAHWLGNASLGLRAGDALHLAIASRHVCSQIVSRDRTFVEAALALGLPGKVVG